MAKDNLPTNSLAAEELKKCNRDLSRFYESEQKKTKELEEAYLDTIRRLATAAEYKDTTTGTHIIRISRYSALLAQKLELPERTVKNILYASPMHDIGKIGIPDNILQKPENLTPEEFTVMKNHTIIGAKILEGSKANVLRVAQRIALYHHEKWDGTGYPYGLSGTKIPLFARIVSLADYFDALVSERPYKKRYSAELACEIIKKERAKTFDPQLADVFLKNIDGILKIKQELDSADKGG